MKRISILFSLLLLPYMLKAQEMSNSFASQARVVRMVDDQFDGQKGTSIDIQLVPPLTKNGEAFIFVEISNAETKELIDKIEVVVTNAITAPDYGKNCINVLNPVRGKHGFSIDYEEDRGRLMFHVYGNGQILYTYNVPLVAFYSNLVDFQTAKPAVFDTDLKKSFGYLKTFFKKVKP